MGRGDRNQAAACSLCAFLTSRLSFWQRSDSSSSLAFMRKASRPPRRSTVFSACALMRSRTLRCRASDIRVTSHRLGRNVRLDLFYIENWSLAYDLFILMKTIPAVISQAVRNEYG